MSQCAGWIETTKKCRYGHVGMHPVCYGYPLLDKITEKNGAFFHARITTPPCCREDLNSSDDGTIIGGKWKG